MDSWEYYDNQNSTWWEETFERVSERLKSFGDMPIWEVAYIDGVPIGAVREVAAGRVKTAEQFKRTVRDATIYPDRWYMSAGGHIYYGVDQ